MAWIGWLDGAQRGRVRALISELAVGRPADPSDDLQSLCDEAIVRDYLADDAPDPRVAIALDRAAHFLPRAGMALFGGASGLGWTLAHLTDGADTELVCRHIDEGLAVAVSVTDDYDLIGGLVGVGVYALERGDAGLQLAEQVLDRLHATARPRGWFTPPTALPAWQQQLAPSGYWNLGVAHGIGGVIGLLARYVREGVAVARASALLDAAVARLLAAEHPDGRRRFPAWHAEPPLAASAVEPSAGLRWCYGDLGLAVVLLAAARARENPSWHAQALALAHAAAAWTFEEARIHDGALCHGAFGVMHVFHRLFQATGDPQLRDATEAWLRHGFALRRADEPIAGYPRYAPHDTREPWAASAALLDGAGGIALALHALDSDVEPSWDRLMLLEL